MRFSILGMGKVGHTTACYLLDKMQEVVVWDRNEDKREFINDHGIDIEGALSGHFAPKVCDSISEAINGADFIIISTLASGHLDIAYLLKDCISSGQHIIAMNSNWAVYEILGILEDSVKEKDITISETSGVHLMSDLVSPGHCILKKIKNRIGISTYPKCKGADVVDNLSGVFPQLYSLGSPVESSMNTSNPILHAPIALFNLSKIEAGIDHFFYRDGGTPLVVKYIEKIDSERLAVLQALGIKGQSCLDIVNKAWNTTYSNLYDAIQANYPNSKGPKSIRYRFITEDVPYGIVPILKIGHLLNINVPFNERLIDMYSAVLDNDFMNNSPDFTLERLYRIMEN